MRWGVGLLRWQRECTKTRWWALTTTGLTNILFCLRHSSLPSNSYSTLNNREGWNYSKYISIIQHTRSSHCSIIPLHFCLHLLEVCLDYILIFSLWNNIFFDSVCRIFCIFLLIRFKYPQHTRVLLSCVVVVVVF